MHTSVFSAHNQGEFHMHETVGTPDVQAHSKIGVGAKGKKKKKKSSSYSMY